MSDVAKVFNTDRRIRLGVWGLGRGLHLLGPCAALNIDVVAGLDYNAYMREQFVERCPNALTTDDLRTFLEADIDAVLLASFLPNHADDAIACLRAGKHVLSEVTAFMTPAEGVRLTEEVERSGLIYQMAENYPFSAENRWLARRWEEGLFGDLMYGEYEYVHEVLTLAYTDINGVPLEPGGRAHPWRSWMSFHYYNTHSLGPIMAITGLRPVEAAALPGAVRLPGFLVRSGDGMGGISPSLVRMSNGGLVRNLMGATTNDSHIQRLWGTKGAAEQVDGALRVRLGGFGSAPKHRIDPPLDDLGRMAAEAGHGGGDFWTIYYFAREILTGQKGPFDVYTTADCTLQGIQAYRSQTLGGIPQPIPDFRRPDDRDAFRHDTFRQTPYDVENGLFDGPAEGPVAAGFNTVVRDLIAATNAVAAAEAWSSIAEDVADPAFLAGIETDAVAARPRLDAAQQAAWQIIEAFPGSDAARVLVEVMDRTAS